LLKYVESEGTLTSSLSQRALLHVVWWWCCSARDAWPSSLRRS